MQSPFPNYFTDSEVLQVGSWSYICSVATDYLIQTPYRCYSRPSGQDRTSKRVERPSMLRHYGQRFTGIFTDPNRLLLFPIPSVFLYSWVHLARQALNNSLDAKRIYTFKREIRKGQTSGFHIEAITRCQKKYSGRKTNRQEMARFYAGQLSLYFTACTSMLFSGIWHASASSFFKVLQHRRTELDHRGRLIYPNFLFALRETHRRRGFYSWFPTCLFMGATVHLMSYSLPLLVLSFQAMLDESNKHYRISDGTLRIFSSTLSQMGINAGRIVNDFRTIVGMIVPFFANWAMGSILCSIGVTASIPMLAARNTYFRECYLQTLYNTEIRTFRQWCSNERLLFQLVRRASRRSIAKNGIKRFLHSSNIQATPEMSLSRSIFHLVCRKSIPFGFCWAMYRAIDAPLGKI
ncbi:coatomer beta [Perkinsela sp. CCAP 1560/4]|nr:coatomer beta [Perkinsela sp. CCAP 1560/4]|eukprot:KNH07147.1 coatomer beta [Perkinsela sp. CCAP 1560/4]